MSPLTADLCARAVIASARIYRDDPLRALTAKRGALRRSVAPAVCALSGVMKVPLTAAARVLGLNSDGIPGLKKRSARFLEAQAAAEGSLLAYVEPLEAPGGVRKNIPAEALKRAGASTPHSPSSAGSAAPLALPRMMAAGRVRREVLASLREEASTGPELMQLVGVGEGQIRDTLSGLKAEGLVTCTALTQEGWGAQFWRLTEGDRG